MTKEQEKFHVMLCSSNSFIYGWLANFVGNDHFNTYAIGHLLKNMQGSFRMKELQVLDSTTRTS